MREPPRFDSVCITGASSGIGAAFARALAAPGVELELVARDEARLRDVAGPLEAERGSTCRLSLCDLRDRDSVGRLAARLEASPPQLLVNNAGCGDFGNFAARDIDAQLALLDVNVRALVTLSHAFVRGSLRRGSGTLLLVSSTAGGWPLPYGAVYGATKTFVLHFGEALWAELRGSGLRVLTLCPGFTATRFGPGLRSPRDWPRAVPPERPVATALAALHGNAPTVVDGRLYALALLAGRVLPRRALLRLAVRWMRRYAGAAAGPSR